MIRLAHKVVLAQPVCYEHSLAFCRQVLAPQVLQTLALALLLKGLGTNFAAGH